MMCSNNNRATTVLEAFIGGVSTLEFHSVYDPITVVKRWMFGGICLKFTMRMNHVPALAVQLPMKGLSTCGGMSVGVSATNLLKPSMDWSHGSLDPLNEVDTFSLHFTFLLLVCTLHSFLVSTNS